MAKPRKKKAFIYKVCPGCNKEFKAYQKNRYNWKTICDECNKENVWQKKLVRKDWW